jgi:UDP-glucose:(heptosyl)LPS alpha-1,3-glucosyltransferase
MDAATVVIPNGVDTALFHPDSASRVQTREALGIPPDALVALFVGGEWERKGLAVAIEAVAKSPDWRLLVVGEGDSERYLGLAAAGGAADRVHFAGRSARPAPFFSAADAFLLPTAYETFSLVTYEAAASGLPLLVTRVSGVEDILEDGVNGWFIDRDGPAVAARLRALATDAALRDGMGRRARMASEGFGWDRMVDRYAELYGELATNGRQGS